MTNNSVDRRRVLIVDDDPKVLDLLVDLLDYAGYEIASTTDGGSALQIASSFQPDLVISDVIMPVLDGIELCKQLKQDLQNANVPVLLVSGLRNSDDDSIEGLTAGADDYLDLPFSNDELLVKVARLTERHRVEKHYREIVEQAGDIIYTHDLLGNFTSLNRCGEKITGYTRQEVLKMNIADMVTPEYRNLIQRMLASTESSKDPKVYELEIATKHGTNVHLEVSTQTIFSNGRPRGVQGIARDLTERKRSEEALRETQAFFHTFMDNSPAVAFMKDDYGRYVYVNKPFEHLFGQQLNLLRGRTSFAWLPEDVAQQTHNNDLSVLSTGNSQEIIETLPMHDGSLHHWLIFRFPTVDASGRRLVGGVGVDITARRDAEEALAQTAEREAMTHRISQAIRCSLDSSEIFHAAVKELGSHLKVDRCSLFIKDERAKLLRNVAEYHAGGLRRLGDDQDIGDLRELMGSLEKEGVLAFDDVAHDRGIRDIYERFLAKAGVRSIMYVAIRVGDDVPAAFALLTTGENRHWSETDIALAKGVADQTGIAIRQAELYQKAEATSTRESLVNRLTTAIRASLSLSEVLSTATRELGRALSASRVLLHLYDPKSTSSALIEEHLAPGVESISYGRITDDDPLGKYLLETAKPVIVDDAINFTEGPAELASCVREQARQLKLYSQIEYPLIVKGMFRGVLRIHQADRLRRWSENEIALVGAVAERLAVGIAQAELFEMVARGKREWETTFDSMSDGIFIFDRNGWLKRVNRAGAALERSHPRALLGRKCCDILRSSSDLDSCVVDQAIEQNRSVTVEITPEQLDRPLLLSVEPVADDQGETTGVVCTARDLSELREVQAVAREHQSLLTNILESARESIYAVDAEGHIKWCNRATLASFGYDREEFIGKPLLDIIYEGDRQVLKEKLQAAMNGWFQTCEVRYFSHDGRLRYAGVDKSPLVVDGRVTGVLGIARDITEQKEERERAARADKLRALGQLASGVAHDFNNSLAAILGRTQLLRRQVQEPKVVRNLDIIQTAAEDAAATVRRIQTFARKAPAKEFALLEIHDLLSDAVEITRTRWENDARLKGLEYKIKLEAEAGQFTHGSASELREVFVNLIVNAVDAMPSGGELSLSCIRERDRLRLQFADTGIGMPEDVRQKIFEPFFTTKGAQGTGLGLSVSYSIIERHDGSISVASEPGRGSVFTIDLPAVDSAPAPVIAAPDVIASTPLSILVIDDEAYVRETLAEMLEAMNHQVVGVASGQLALQKLASRDFDLVFTDLAMPEMDGWETAREIRKRWPGINIVMVTGYGPGARPPRGEENLIDAIIGKPFDFSQVSEKVMRFSTTKNTVA